MTLPVTRPHPRQIRNIYTAKADANDTFIDPNYVPYTMPDETHSDSRSDTTVDVQTSGHVERAVLGAMLDPDGRCRPTTVGEVLPAVRGVVERGDYGNVGPRSPATVVRRSSVRRTFGQLDQKGLVQRVEDVPVDELRADRNALGPLEGDDPTDPRSYARVSDDGRVTDWLLTTEGLQEIERLDTRYAAELDELAARYGRPPGETTTRIDPDDTDSNSAGE